MFLRRAIPALFIVALTALSGCKKTTDELDAQDEVQNEDREQEPNDDREHCDHIEDGRTLVGELTASDIDVLCAKGLYTLHVFAQPSVQIALEDRRGQRVELGTASGEDIPTLVHLPGNDWVVSLRGHGDWRVEVPESAETRQSYCGIRLIDERTPIVLGIQDLPAVFPLCADEKVGAAHVQFPSLVPSGVAGFEINVDGVDEHSRGVIRVQDNEHEILRHTLEPDRRAPALRWGADSIITAQLRLAQEEEPKTLYLRVDPVETPSDAKQFLELEPNDSVVQAIRIPREGVVAGVLYHSEDVDWFQVDPFVGDMRVEVITQGDTKLRVQGIGENDRQDALYGEDGMYRICSLQSRDEDTALQNVRIAYAPGAVESSGVYQLTFESVTSTIDRLTPIAQIEVPTHEPTQPFGFLERTDSASGQADEAPRRLGYQNENRVSKAHTTRRGRIVSSEEEHGWIVQVPPTEEDVRVSIHARGHAAIDLKLRVLDADGITVATVDKGAAGEDEQLELELPAGYYVIGVRATGARGCEGEYTLQIDSPDANPAHQGVEADAQPSPKDALDARQNDGAPLADPSRRETEQVDGEDETSADKPSEDNIPDYPW